MKKKPPLSWTRVGNPSTPLIIPVSRTEQQLIVSNSSLLLERREIWHGLCVGLTSQAARRPPRHVHTPVTDRRSDGRIITWLVLQATNSFVWWPCLHDVRLKKTLDWLTTSSLKLWHSDCQWKRNEPRGSPSTSHPFGVHKYKQITFLENKNKKSTQLKVKITKESRGKAM